MIPAKRPGCLIIDANVFSLFGKTPIQDEAAKLIAKGLNKKTIKIASGGKNRRELVRVLSAKKWLTERLRSGHAFFYDDKTVDSEEKKITSTKVCISDDQHIIALSNVSGAKLLFSQDQALHKDFKKICNGSIYQDVSHSNLLGNCPPCKAL